MSLYLCHRAGPVGLLGQAQQLLPLDRSDAVVGQQIEHVDLTDSVPAEVDAADLGLRPADRPGRLLRADAAALPQSPQLSAEQDAQHGWPLRRLWHGASRISTRLRNCFSQLRGNVLPLGIGNRHGIPYGIACHSPTLAARPCRGTHLSLDASVSPVLVKEPLSSCSLAAAYGFGGRGPRVARVRGQALGSAAPLRSAVQPSGRPRRADRIRAHPDVPGTTGSVTPMSGDSLRTATGRRYSGRTFRAQSSFTTICLPGRTITRRTGDEITIHSPGVCSCGAWCVLWSANLESVSLPMSAPGGRSAVTSTRRRSRPIRPPGCGRGPSLARPGLVSGHCSCHSPGRHIALSLANGGRNSAISNALLYYPLDARKP